MQSMSNEGRVASGGFGYCRTFADSMIWSISESGGIRGTSWVPGLEVSARAEEEGRSGCL